MSLGSRVLGLEVKGFGTGKGVLLGGFMRPLLNVPSLFQDLT